MEFEDRLRTGVEALVRIETEGGAVGELGRLNGPVEAECEAGKADESLGVMRVGGGRLHLVAGDEIVNRGKAGRIGMSPGDALNGGKSRKRERIADLVHADVGKDQNIDRVGLDHAAGAGDIARKKHESLYRGGEGSAEWVIVLADGENGDVQVAAGQAGDQIACELGDSMQVEVAGDEANAKLAAVTW